MWSPDNILLLAAEAGLEDTSPGHRRVWVRYPEGLSLGYQSLLGLVPGKGEMEGPVGELKLALLHGCHESQADPQRFIVAPYPGFLLCQDTYFVGRVKGLGEAKVPKKLFLQSVVDVHCSFAFAKLYLTKSARTAADLLQDRVFPFYQQQGLKVERLLTDNGKEYGGRQAQHLFKTTLILAGIEHIRCESLPAAEDNPFCVQFHRILAGDFFAPAFRTNYNLHLDTLQQNLDAFLKRYNCERPCPGIRTQGRPPFRAFLDGAGSAARLTNAACAGRQL